MRRARWLIPAVTLVVALSGVTALAQDADDLDGVRSRLSQIENEIERAEATAEDADAELANATERLAEVEAIVNDLAMQLEQQEARVASAQAELEALQAQAAAVQAAFDARTVELFKSGYGSDLDAVLSAGDIQEAIDRRTLLDQVNESDQATIEQVQAAQGAVLTQQDPAGDRSPRGPEGRAGGGPPAGSPDPRVQGAGCGQRRRPRGRARP